MNSDLRSATSLLVIAIVLTACAGPQERIILLPDREGHVGRIEVSTASGVTELNEAFSGARISGTRLITEKIGEDEVKRRYGKVLDALPTSPRRYILNFEIGSDRLTTQSRTMLPGFLGALKQFPAPEVVVTGHADNLGTAAVNDKLSLDRANRVRDILLSEGIPGEAIQTVGRGSREQLVPAKPGAPEPRNRRVEIKLR